MRGKDGPDDVSISINYTPCNVIYSKIGLNSIDEECIADYTKTPE